MLLSDWMLQTWNMLLEAGPWLLGGFVFAGVLYLLLPRERIVAHLGRPGLGGVLKAALVGVPLPLCSCSVIPVASSLRRRGASRGATASFLISTPETGVDSIAISYALLGPVLAVARPIAAFITAMIAGTLVSFVESRETRRPQPSAQGEQQPAGSCCCAARAEPPKPPQSCCATGEHHDEPRLAGSFFGRVRQALHYGLVEMFANLSHWLIIGFLLGGLVTALLPPDFLGRWVGSGLGTMLVITLVGLPLYICSTSATPVAAALIARGLSPGAALVLLLVGPATNVATMVVVGRELGRLSLALYLGTIAIVSIILGLTLDAIWPDAARFVASDVTHIHEHASPLAWISAIILALLMLNGLRIRLSRLRSARHPTPASAPVASAATASE